MEDGSEGQTLQGVRKAFKIVRHIKESGPTTVTALADALDLPKSTAHIHLKTMAEAGYLYKDDGTYRLSLHFLSHGTVVRREFEIYQVAKGEINSLAEETGEVASIGVEEGGKRVLLYKSEGGDAVYDNSHTGEFTEMHWTSLGKALLAHMPRERVEAIVDEYGLPRATEHTITEPEALYDELEGIREQGYALEDEEHWENIRAVSVPVLSEHGIIGAISLSGPKARFSDSHIEERILDPLYDKANVIELRLKHY